MRPRRPALAVFAVVVGCFALAFSSRISATRFASEYDPGPRLLPLVSGLATLALGLVAGCRRVERTSESNGGHVSKLRVFGMVGGLVLYPYLAPWLGFYLATTTFVLLFSRALEATWRASAMGALAVSGICFLVFERVFHVALPESALGFPF